MKKLFLVLVLTQYTMVYTIPADINARILIQVIEEESLRQLNLDRERYNSVHNAGIQRGFSVGSLDASHQNQNYESEWLEADPARSDAELSDYDRTYSDLNADDMLIEEDDSEEIKLLFLRGFIEGYKNGFNSTKEFMELPQDLDFYSVDYPD